MDKKDILEKSRQENKGTDFVEKQAIASASQKAVAVGGIVCMLLFFVELCVLDRWNYSLWAIYLSITGTTLLVKFAYLRKKHELIFGICELALAIAFIVIHFLRVNG